MLGFWSFLFLLFVGTVKSVSVIEQMNADKSAEEYYLKGISANDFNYFEGKFKNRTNDSRGIKMPCECKDGECACCTGNILQNFNINMRQRFCMNVTYEPEEFSIGVKMSINDLVLFSNSVSGKSPPPFCVRVPRIQPLRFCGRFTNVYFINRNVHACIVLEVEWNRKTVFSYNLDCVRLGANGVALVSAEAGGGLPHPTDQGTDDVEDYDESNVGGQTTKKPTKATTKKPNRRKTTKKPASNQDDENPEANATTKKPNRRKTTKKPISGDGTTEIPIASATADKPIANPTNEKPIANPTNERPIANLANERPIAGATSDKPIANPTNEEPVANLANERPIAGATADKPVSHDAGKPGPNAVEEKPSINEKPTGNPFVETTTTEDLNLSATTEGTNLKATTDIANSDASDAST